MTDELDRALSRLASRLPERSLARLEADVWAMVRGEGDGASASAPIRAAAVMAALGLGVLAGGMSAATARVPSEVAVFSIAAAIAPSSLLDTRS